jgi:hypothetical protein
MTDKAKLSGVTAASVVLSEYPVGSDIKNLATSQASM